MSRTSSPHFPTPYRSARLEWERHYLLTALRQHKGNVTETAKAIGLSRRNLQLRLRKLEIKPSELRQDTQAELFRPKQRATGNAEAVQQAA